MDAVDQSFVSPVPAAATPAVVMAPAVVAAPAIQPPAPNVELSAPKPIMPADALTVGVMKAEAGAAPDLPSVDLRRAPENQQVKQVANAGNAIQYDTAIQAVGAGLDTQKQKVLSSDPGSTVDQTTKAGRELASLQTQQVKAENNRFAGDVQRVDDQVTYDTSTSWVARLNNSTAHFDWRRQGVDTTLTTGLQAQAALEKTQQQAKQPVAPITPTAGSEAAQAQVATVVAAPQAKPRQSAIDAFAAELAAAPVKAATPTAAPVAGSDRAATAAEVATAAAMTNSAFTQQARSESLTNSAAPAAAAQSRAISSMSLNQSTPVFAMSSTFEQAAAPSRSMFSSVNPDGASLGTTSRAGAWSQTNAPVEAQFTTPRAPQQEFRSSSPMGRLFATPPMDMAYGLLPGASSAQTRQVRDAVIVNDDKAAATGTIQNAGSLALSLKPSSDNSTAVRGMPVSYMLAMASNANQMEAVPAAAPRAAAPVAMRAQQSPAPQTRNQPAATSLPTMSAGR